MISTIHDAYTKVESQQAKLPPAKTDKERLVRMLDLDQAGRQVYVHMDFNTLPATERFEVRNKVWAEIGAHDLADQVALRAMMPPTGWFTISRYGKDGEEAAFLVVQHAVSDPELMKVALSRMAPLVAKGEVSPTSYALLYDRVSLDFDKRPQRYGSQVQCVAGKWAPETLEDPSRVDDRRRAIGLKPPTEAEYLKNFDGMPCS